MAVTVTFFNLFKLGQVDGSHFVNFDSATFALTLHTSALGADLDIDTMEFYDDLVHELGTVGNYTLGGQDLTGTSVNLDTANDFVYFDAADVTWAVLTATFRYAVLRQNTGNPTTDVLIFVIDFGEDKVLAAADFVVQWPPSTLGSVLKMT